MMSDQYTHIVIAVMGVTGVGKSFFVEKASGQRAIVGDGLESCGSKYSKESC
jgi:signal recognition particle receptor subunit beta